MDYHAVEYGLDPNVAPLLMDPLQMQTLLALESYCMMLVVDPEVERSGLWIGPLHRAMWFLALLSSFHLTYYLIYITHVILACSLSR